MPQGLSNYTALPHIHTEAFFRVLSSSQLGQQWAQCHRNLSGAADA